MRMELPRLVIEIEQGDISSQHTDAIVNAANNHLWMGGGVAGAIKKAGGVEIEKDAVAKGPVSVGEAVCTDAGRLHARYVIHAAVMGQDLTTDESKIEAATRSSIRMAKALDLRSISFPALGTGVGGFPIARAAEIMIAAVTDECCRSPSSLTLVRFVLFGEDALRTFEKAATDYQQVLRRPGGARTDQDFRGS